MHRNDKKVIVLFFALFVALVVILFTPEETRLPVTMVFGFCLIAVALLFFMAHMHRVD